MRENKGLISLGFFFLVVACVNGGNPYRYFNWKVTYGEISPYGVKQQVILINNQFPGPQIKSMTNDNLIISVTNNLDEPFLLSWNGLQNRKNSWEDGVYGTNCPILPGKNFTYKLQVKDQIGSFFYFPSLALHKAVGGYGGITISSLPWVPVPFPPPAGDFTILAGDWFKRSHKDLKKLLDAGRTNFPAPHGILINGYGPNNKTIFTVNQGGTYRFRISNMGIATSFNFRIQRHKLKLVEVEGSHTIQNTYDSLDVHLGQSYSVLVTCDQPAQDYYMVVSSRFTKKVITSTAILHYNNSTRSVSGAPPSGPPTDIQWSLNQARSFVRNLTASGPRPNPQGTYHYGNILVARTIRIGSNFAVIGGKRRYTANGVSFIPADTPLKLADYYNISGVFTPGSIPDNPPPSGDAHLNTSVMVAGHKSFVEFVFENYEDTVQSWHIDGYAFFVVGMDFGRWSNASREIYNLHDAVTRSTIQVYPKAWTAIYVALDNVGMWNVRSEEWGRQYLGQQFYLKITTSSYSLRNEYHIPSNVILCGRAKL